MDTTTDTPAMTCAEIDAALHRLELRHGLAAMRTVASTLALTLDSMAPGRLETLLGSVETALDERGQRRVVAGPCRLDPRRRVQGTG